MKQSSPAKFGALFVNPHELSTAHEAEALGYDSIWVAGHMLWANPTAEVISSLGYLAAKTEHAHIGSAILLLPLYSALAVAKSFAMLQTLSGSRTILGVGIGGEFAPEFAAAGVRIEDRARTANEQLRLIRHLWHHPGEELDDGPYRVTRDAPPLFPRVAPPPIFIGGRSMGAIRRATRYGDGILPYFVTPDQYVAMRGEVESRLVAQGRSEAEFHFACALFICPSSTTQEGRRAAVDYFRWQYGINDERLVDRYAVIGPPDRCAETYARFIEAGVRHFVNIPIGRAPAREQFEAVREVIDAIQ